MSDWVVALLMLYAYANGFVMAWAIAHREQPMWQGFLDGLAAPFVWFIRRQ